MVGKPIPGQVAAFDRGEPLVVFDPRERRAFGNALDEVHLGKVALDAFVESDLGLVTPDHCKEVLFTASNRSESRFVNGVAINAFEAEAVPGSVNHLTKRVAQRTENSRIKRGDTNAERRAEKAGKSKVETLRGYLEKREGVLNGLEYDLTELNKVKEALQRPGLNRGYESTILGRLNYVVRFVFGNMFEVVADESNWNNITRKSALEAMRYQIILSPRRISYTRQMTDVGIHYTRTKKNIFSAKYSWAEKGLAKLEKSGQSNLLES